LATERRLDSSFNWHASKVRAMTPNHALEPTAAGGAEGDIRGAQAPSNSSMQRTALMRRR
jgi:hypothetical protein